MVAAGGARFHVATLGAGPTVLLLHGFPQFWWTWRDLLPPLAEAGYRAVAMDLRGFGASDKPPRGYDPRTLAADAVGTVRSLGVGTATVVGHGLGGLVAWTAATLHPQVVSGVAVISMPHPRSLRTSLSRDPARLRRMRHLAGFQVPMRPERRLVADDGAEVARLLHRWSAGAWPDLEAERRYRQAMQIPGVAHCSLESHRWAVRSLPRSDGIGYHHAMRTPVRVPTLHVHGGSDPFVDLSSNRGSARHVEAPYRWAVVENAGHFPQEECPIEVQRLLLDWLAAEDGGT
jgi:pimeloyl-ACP methyl ester carboxylesterase